MQIQTITRTGAITGAMLLSAFAVSGCATKGFVRDQVAQEDVKVTSQVAEVQGTAKDALDRANAAHTLAEGKFLYQVVLSDDSVKFPTDQHALSTEAESRLTEFVGRLKSENKNVYLEIQGHTDSTGAKPYNEKLGEERAEAVRRYLNEQGVALNRMATISYGMDVPVASNDNPEGRAQNRRVVIIVLT
jgi:outer membrane protein OmpA-like peptidoglycan-associated protein